MSSSHGFALAQTSEMYLSILLLQGRMLLFELSSRFCLLPLPSASWGDLLRQSDHGVATIPVGYHVFEIRKTKVNLVCLPFMSVFLWVTNPSLLSRETVKVQNYIFEVGVARQN